MPRYTFNQRSSMHLTDILLKFKIFYIRKCNIEYSKCRFCVLMNFISILLYFLFRIYGQFVIVYFKTSYLHFFKRIGVRPPPPLANTSVNQADALFDTRSVKHKCQEGENAND